MAFLLRNPKHRYSCINDEHGDCKSTTVDTNHSGFILLGYRLAACILILAALTGALGAWVGQNAFQFQHQASRDSPVETAIGFHSEKQILRTFGYNQTFTHAPSKKTNMAWDSLFPKGMGYIVDPAGRLEAVGISVFHQLHCLDLLRHLYYAAELRTGPTTPDNKPEIHPHRHARHCFDYLRQALMCAADSTIEPGNATTKYVTGFGAVHECQDYDGLVAWTEERRLKPEDLAVPLLNP